MAKRPTAKQIRQRNKMKRAAKTCKGKRGFKACMKRMLKKK